MLLVDGCGFRKAGFHTAHVQPQLRLVGLTGDASQHGLTQDRVYGVSSDRQAAA